jgi:APA family basic amino acid/polyamine antiporter
MAPVGFRKDLGLPTAVTIIVGSMIGSGILILPGNMAALVGNSGLLVLAWVVPGFLTIAGALTFAEMASAYPRAGGQYVFLREGLGRAWSFLFGWAMFWVIMTGIIAAVAIAFARFLDALLLASGLGALPGAPFALGPLVVPKWGQALVAVLAIVGLSAVNWVGVRYGGLVQNLSTGAKVAGIGGLIVAAFAFGHPTHAALGTTLDLAPSGADLLTAFGLAVVLSLFAYDGWPQATYVAAEVRDAKRNLPRALVVGPLITMAVYLTAVLAYVYVLPVAQAAEAGQSGGIATVVAQALAGPVGVQVVAAVAMVSTFGTVNAYVLSSPRVFYAMSRDGALLRSMSRLDPKTATPAFAILLTAEWASLLVLTGTYAQIVTAVVFSLWLFYIPTILAYFRLHRDPSVAKPFRTPLYPAVPLAFLGAAVFIVLVTLLTPASQPQALLALLLIGAGVPVYWWQARRAPRRRETVLAPVEERNAQRRRPEKV